MLPETSISSYQVPCRIDVRTKSVDCRDRFQRAVADGHGEETAATQNDEVIAMDFDDAAFVDACVLSVSNRFIFSALGSAAVVHCRRLSIR